MIISEQWLREWVNPPLETDALAEQLTMAGLEVDAVAPVAQPFEGVVVAEIKNAEQHPDADKLRVCTVDAGTETVQIVCGAPNAVTGLKAPLAKVGARLPGDFKIKQAKLRGIASQGMLCAGAELTISEDNDGLMALPGDAPVGTDLREYLSLDDHTLEIGLTPNRADCLSILGIARDVAALNGLALCEPESAAVDVQSTLSLPVEVSAPDKCPRYIGRVIADVDLSVSTPLHMQERLRRAGLRSIDPVVDVTNYVMLELGQPLHAFDLDELRGGIVVRNAAPGESLTLLDGSEISLCSKTLVIADQERPLALAGIMGGEGSGVSASTQSIFLESAFFAPELIAGRARQYGLHTDASHRYERGVDPELQRRAIERASELLLEITGGAAGPLVETVSEEHLPKLEPITLRASWVQRVLGFALTAEAIEGILNGLGFAVHRIDEGVWSCGAPSWRFDMTQEVDLIEELARVHGYNNLPASRIHAELRSQIEPEGRRSLRHLRQRLIARGFQEAITFSFISRDQQQLFALDATPIQVQNPISTELAEMRLSLLPGLTAALAHNVKRQNPRLRLFETGACFTSGEPYSEQRMLGLAMVGNRAVESWTSGNDRLDFFDLKGEIEQLLVATREPISFRKAQRAGLHDGQTAHICLGDQVIGVMGRVHPAVAKKMSVPADALLAELDMDGITDVQVPNFEEISRYPETRRDIAIVVGSDVEATAVQEAIWESAGEGLVDLCLFDLYVGEGIPPDHKSFALGLTFRDKSRTLDDDDVAGIISQVVDSLREKFNAELRD